MNFPGRAAAGGVDARGCAELQRSDVRVERVHTAISHHATAKIPPAPPGGRVIGTVAGPHRGRANPCIPVEPRGHGHRLLGALGPLRTPPGMAPGVIREAAPRIDLTHLAELARPDPLARLPDAFSRVTLDSHLGCDLGFS